MSLRRLGALWSLWTVAHGALNRLETSLPARYLESRLGSRPRPALGQGALRRCRASSAGARGLRGADDKIKLGLFAVCLRGGSLEPQCSGRLAATGSRPPEGSGCSAGHLRDPEQNQGTTQVPATFGHYLVITYGRLAIGVRYKIQLRKQLVSNW